jgi:hypothetical protein
VVKLASLFRPRAPSQKQLSLTRFEDGFALKEVLFLKKKKEKKKKRHSVCSWIYFTSTMQA